MRPSAECAVLIVEDQDDLRNLLAYLLTAEGYEVLVAGSGEAALELLKGRTGGIDVVITDLGLPGLGGIDLIPLAKAFCPSLRVVAISAYDNPRMRKAVEAAGAHAFMVKPFNELDMLNVVKAFMEEQ